MTCPSPTCPECDHHGRDRQRRPPPGPAGTVDDQDGVGCGVVLGDRGVRERHRTSKGGGLAPDVETLPVRADDDGWRRFARNHRTSSALCVGGVSGLLFTSTLLMSNFYVLAPLRRGRTSHDWVAPVGWGVHRRWRSSSACGSPSRASPGSSSSSATRSSTGRSPDLTRHGYGDQGAAAALAVVRRELSRRGGGCPRHSRRERRRLRGRGGGAGPPAGVRRPCPGPRQRLPGHHDAGSLALVEPAPSPLPVRLALRPVRGPPVATLGLAWVALAVTAWHAVVGRSVMVAPRRRRPVWRRLPAVRDAPAGGTARSACSSSRRWCWWP